MNWQDLVDERKKRDQARFATTGPSSFFNTPTQDDGAADVPDVQSGGGFFGKLLHPITHAVHDIGALGNAGLNFFGNMAHDVVESAKTAGKAVEGIGEGVVDQVRANRNLNHAKELQDKFKQDYNSGALTDPTERQARLKEINDILTANQHVLENKNLTEADPKKAAAAAGETVLNFATLGGPGLVEGVAKGTLKAGALDLARAAAEDGAKGVVKQFLKKGAVDAAETAAETGGKAAAKTVGKNVAEGALFGGAYGALSPWKTKGKDATGADVLHSALLGAGLGGAFGGAGSLLDKNVRSEAFKLPGRVADSAGDLASNLRAFDAAQGEGGFIKNPLAPGTPETPAWAPERMFKTLSPEEESTQSLVNQVASEYNSADQFLEDTARAAHNYDTNAKGGQMVNRGDGNYARTTEHTPFYSQYYAENGRKPSYAATKQAVQDALEGKAGGHSFVSPEEAQVYQTLQDRDNGLNSLINDPEAAQAGGAFDHQPAADSAAELQSLLTGKPVTPSRNPAGLPKGPGGTVPLDGLEAESGNLQGRHDDPAALQAALARKEAETNPLIDYVDPRARAAATPTTQSALPVDAVDPYSGMDQDLSRLALGPGAPPDPLTPGAAKRVVRGGGDAPEVLNTLKDGKKTFELPSNVEDMQNVAVKLNKNGDPVPVATNNAHPTQGYVDAVRAIAEDDTGSRFTNTRTPELNNEEALAKRGGTNSPLFKELNQNNIDLREATARQATYMADETAKAKDFVKEFKWTQKMDESKAARAYFESANPDDEREAFVAFRNEFGQKASDGLAQLRDQWREENPIIRQNANKVIERYAGADRTIGDLGETYLTRVYKKKGLASSAIDLAHSGLDKIGGKNGLLNLEAPGDYLSKETESTAGALRSVNQAPLNSDVAKPNTRFLASAQKRTAEDAQRPLEGVLKSTLAYKDAVSRSQELTPVIAKGRSQQKVIEMVNGESGNLRQMYDSLNDQLNAISGKTNSFDQKFVNTETGNKVVSVASKLQSRISRSTIVGSANSAIAQTGQLPLIFAENGAKNFAQGMGDVFRYIGDKVSPIDDSSLMATRYPKGGEGMFSLNPIAQATEKVSNVINKPFHILEKASTELAWYSSYARAVGDMGLTGKEAIQEADRMTAKIIGERSAGARAALYESKALQPVSAYTLEVNQLYQIAKQYFKRDPKKAVALVGALWLYNQGYKAVTGNTLNADPIQAGIDAKNILTNTKDANGEDIGLGERLVRAGGRIAGEAVDATPLGGQVVGQLYPQNGFRIPFGGGKRALTKSDVFGNTNVGRYAAQPPITAGIGNPLLLLGIPGMAQIQRSFEGNRAVQQGGVFDKNGDPKFNITNTSENQLRALLWGMYSTKEGRAYLQSQEARASGSAVR